MKKLRRKERDPVAQLLELYASNPYVARFFKALANQTDVVWHRITPEWVQVKVSCRSRQQAIQTLRAVGATKVAEFILGRKGGETRLDWGFFHGEDVAREVIQEVNKRIYSLAEQAEGENEVAVDKLTYMAITAEISERRLQNASWAAIAEMVAPGGPPGQQVDSEDIPADGPSAVGPIADPAVATQSPSDSEFVETKILLRPDLFVTLNLPKNLTENEAARLGGVVRNLWLVPSGKAETEQPTLEPQFSKIQRIPVSLFQE